MSLTYKNWVDELKEREKIEWMNGQEKILDAKITEDLIKSGQYLDDDCGGSEFISDVMIVKELMALKLLACYNNNIEKIVVENIGSDFIGTI